MPKDVTTAVTVAPANPALPVTPESAYGIGGLAMAAGVALLWLRRRLSRDTLEAVKDRAEGGLVKTLMEVNAGLVKENERLMQTANEAWKVRNADAVRIATLEGQLEAMRRDLERLTNAAKNSGMMPLEPRP